MAGALPAISSYSLAFRVSLLLGFGGPLGAPLRAPLAGGSPVTRGGPLGLGCGGAQGGVTGGEANETAGGALAFGLPAHTTPIIAIRV